MQEQSVKRYSILHAQNIFLVNPVNIFPVRETGKYIIGYEPKRYRIHNLVYKIDNRLISKTQNKTQNPMIFSVGVDINVREDFRYSLKFSDPDSRINGKNVTIRVVPTRYTELQPLYAIFYQFQWRRTGMGGIDELSFKILECPTVSNSNTVNTVCYKKIGNQVSFGGTHGTSTYLLLSPQKGQYEIGKWVRATNVNWGGHRHVYVNPVTITL